MTGPHTEAAAPPADRYGRRDPAAGRRAVLVAGGLLVVALVAWAAWSAHRQTDKPVRWATGSFAVVDDGHASLEVLVTMDAGREAVCTVRLFNTGLTEVGRADVTVGPGTGAKQRKTVTIPTFEQATSGTVQECVAR